MDENWTVFYTLFIIYIQVIQRDYFSLNRVEEGVILNNFCRINFFRKRIFYELWSGRDARCVFVSSTALRCDLVLCSEYLLCSGILWCDLVGGVVVRRGFLMPSSVTQHTRPHHETPYHGIVHQTTPYQITPEHQTRANQTLTTQHQNTPVTRRRQRTQTYVTQQQTWPDNI